MQTCILKFKKADQAEEALTRLVHDQGNQNAWLHEVGEIKRPLIGRISIRATYGEPTELREGDIASKLAQAGKWTGYVVGSLAGPLRAHIQAIKMKRAVTPMAKQVEKTLLGIDDIKEFLPRGTSALVLVAGEEECDRMVDLFHPWQPEVVRRDLGTDVQDILEDLHHQAEQSLESAAE